MGMVAHVLALLFLLGDSTAFKTAEHIAEVATLQAEIQTLREEHRAETATLRAEVVRIRAENDDMRNRLGIMEGADEQMLELREQTTCSCQGSCQKHTIAFTKNACPTCSDPKAHCKHNCAIPKTWTQKNWKRGGPPNWTVPFLNAQCNLDTQMYEKLKMLVKDDFSDPKHPKWTLHISGGPYTVGCPCNSGSKVMAADQALRNILGQVSSIGVHEGIGYNIYKRATRGEFYLMTVSYAVTKMFTCWTRKCSAPVVEESTLLQNNRAINDLLSDDLQATATAGWDCG